MSSFILPPVGCYTPQKKISLAGGRRGIFFSEWVSFKWWHLVIHFLVTTSLLSALTILASGLLCVWLTSQLVIVNVKWFSFIIFHNISSKYGIDCGLSLVRILGNALPICFFHLPQLCIFFHFCCCLLHFFFLLIFTNGFSHLTISYDLPPVSANGSS